VRFEEVFAVFVVCHLAGDFLLQTDWQALNKRGGLSRDRESRRALFSHVSVYTLVFVPAVIWIATQRSPLALVLLPAVFIPHLVQDDGRSLSAWNRAVKGSSPQPGGLVYTMVDQSFHIVVLFATALLAVS